MRIVHYIPDILKSDIVADYVNMLSKHHSENDKVRLVTDKDKVETLMTIKDTDILHVHTCWSRKTAYVVEKAVKGNVAVVLSPHGSLESYVVENEQPKMKKMQLLAYQKGMLKNADAVVVTNTSEFSHIEKMGWTTRLQLEPSAVFDSSVAPSDMTASMLRLYTKVLDTRYFLRMSLGEKEAICSMVHYGMSRDIGCTMLSDEDVKNVRMLNPEQWKRILLYSDDEHISNIIDYSTRVMQIPVPAIDTHSIDRFPVTAHKIQKSLSSDVLFEGNGFRTRILSEETDAKDVELRNVLTMLCNISYLAGRREMGMNHLAEMYETLRYGDFDEKRFGEIARKLRLMKFSRRLMSVLNKYLRLTEGFMPVAPLNDNGKANLMIMENRAV